MAGVCPIGKWPVQRLGAPTGHRKHGAGGPGSSNMRHQPRVFARRQLRLFIERDPNADHSALYQLPSLGGTPRQVLFDVDSPVSFSPDGKRLVFVRQSPESMTSSLMLANADGSGEQKLAALSFPSRFLQEGPVGLPTANGLSYRGPRRTIPTNTSSKRFPRIPESKKDWAPRSGRSSSAYVAARWLRNSLHAAEQQIFLYGGAVGSRLSRRKHPAHHQ